MGDLDGIQAPGCSGHYSYLGSETTDGRYLFFFFFCLTSSLNPPHATLLNKYILKQFLRVVYDLGNVIVSRTPDFGA